MTKVDITRIVSPMSESNKQKNPNKPKQVRVYLNDENESMLRALAEKVDMPESQIMTMLVSASLRAAKENDYILTLPIRFHVDANDALFSVNAAPRKPSHVRQ
jgi:hypothetical protein